MHLVLGDLEEEFKDIRRTHREIQACAHFWLTSATRCAFCPARVLGARTVDVLRLVVVEGMTPALIGICAGAVAAPGSARILEQLVFGVSESDPLTLAAVAGTLAIVALFASLVPAYRASRVDPLTVLRAN
jgi:predicted lysophospholipase L1 biosynthesis ABC-type transport system permease subunit